MAEKNTINHLVERWARLQSKCPYCFREFCPDEAHFRLPEGMEVKARNIDEDGDYGILPKFERRKDIKLNAFLEEYPDSSEKTAMKPNYIVPVKDSELWPDLSGDILYGRLVRDSDGFPYAINYSFNVKEHIDEFGGADKLCSIERLCPHCHNVLPFEFGKHEVKYIAVVGITGSGKTVYLAQLFKNLTSVMYHSGLEVLGTRKEIDDYVKKHPIVVRQKLPGSTQKHILNQPLPITVKNVSKDKMYTIIFYDIAGEDCIKVENLRKYGPYVVNADGYLLIIDPIQFNYFELSDEKKEEDKVKEKVKEKGKEDEEEDEEEARSDPFVVPQAMYDAFFANQYGGKKCPKPFAVVLSKSDMFKNIVKSDIREILTENSNIYKNIEYDRYTKMGFAEEEAYNISGEIEALLNTGENIEGKVLTRNINNMYEKKEYFAVSALNGSDSNYEPKPIRIEEPLFWILNSLGVINSAVESADDDKGGIGNLFKKIFKN